MGNNPWAEWLIERGYAPDYDALAVKAIRFYHDTEIVRLRVEEEKRRRGFMRADREEVNRFISECTEPSDIELTKVADLHDAYVDYCQGHPERTMVPLTLQGFGRHMKAIVRSHRKSDGMYYAVVVPGSMFRSIAPAPEATLSDFDSDDLPASLAGLVDEV